MPVQPLAWLQNWRKSGRAEHWGLDGEDLLIHTADHMEMSWVKDESVLQIVYTLLQQIFISVDANPEAHVG